MADKKTEELKITRREFIAGAGTVIAIGAVSNLAACAPPAAKTETQAYWRGSPLRLDCP